MPKRFLHVGINFAGKTQTAELKPTFDKALDWYRYAPNCWILWTNSDADKWYSRLKPKLTDEDRFLIVEINFDLRNGWLSTDAWEWINKKRE